MWRQLFTEANGNGSPDAAKRSIKCQFPLAPDPYKIGGRKLIPHRPAAAKSET